MAINPNTRLISGSEIKSWQGCQMRWWYEYRLKVLPKKLSDGLFRGVVGHECLSAYYRAIKRGESIEEAALQIKIEIAKETNKNVKLMMEGFISGVMMGERVKLIAEVNALLDAYINEWAEEDQANYEVVEVEHMHVGDNFMAMRLDLLLRERATGKLVLTDHKFVSDFYSPKQLMANSQLPLYMRIVVGDRSEEVSHGVLNEIRTRKLKDGPEFTRPIIKYNEIVAKKRASDQAKIAEQIRENYRVPFDKSRGECIRNLSDYSCKFCPFATPCFLDLEGREAEMKETVNAEYEENTYGYNK